MSRRMAGVPRPHCTPPSTRPPGAAAHASALALLLELRRHLSIVHHLPGRIRLRLAPALWGQAARLNQRFDTLLPRLAGIRGIRVNAAVASVIVEYDPHTVPPQHWETLVRGDATAAGEVLERWLRGCVRPTPQVPTAQE